MSVKFVPGRFCASTIQVCWAAIEAARASEAIGKMLLVFMVRSRGTSDVEREGSLARRTPSTTVMVGARLRYPGGPSLMEPEPDLDVPLRRNRWRLWRRVATVVVGVAL